MPFVLALLRGAVSSTVLRALVVRLAVAVGISVATYSGVGLLFSSVFANAASSMNGSGAINFLLMCKVPQAFNAIASAYTAALAFKGLSGAGVLRKIKWGGAGSVLGG